MEFEIWASDSGNRLFATADLEEALRWALIYLLREGDDAFEALSVGDDQDQWVIRGQELRDLIGQHLWQPTALWATSANDRHEDWTEVSHLHLTRGAA
jgi:hypothetical protein